VKGIFITIFVLALGIYFLMPVESISQLDITKLTPTQQQQFDKATVSKDALGKRLASVLTAKMKADGPVAAIELCNIRALPMTAEISAQQGVRLGRTSFGLRNQVNVAPMWASASVADKIEDTQAFAGSDGSLSVLYPIKTQAKCLICHASEGKVAAPLVSLLHEKYPNDQAFGFIEGSLRGYFWVEVAAE
jgi:hypothetical protein